MKILASQRIPTPPVAATNMPRLREFLPRNAKYSAKEDSWFISYRQKKSLVAFDFQAIDSRTKGE